MGDVRSTLQAALGGAYRIERELGDGGMSRVSLATETALNRRVVVKELPSTFAAGFEVDRFQREIRIAAGLQHPHIVPRLAASATAEPLGYSVPYVEGQSLRARLAKDGELPIGDALRLLREVADALARPPAAVGQGNTERLRAFVAMVLEDRGGAVRLLGESVEAGNDVPAVFFASRLRPRLSTATQSSRRSLSGSEGREPPCRASRGTAEWTRS